MALLVDLPPFSKRVQDMDLLTYEPIIFKCSLGMALYTVSKMQVNVNVVLPTEGGQALELLQRTGDYLTSVHVGCAVNLNPIKNHSPIICGDCFMRRRFIPHASYVRHIELVENTMIKCYQIAIPLTATIAEPYDITGTSRSHEWTLRTTRVHCTGTALRMAYSAFSPTH